MAKKILKMVSKIFKFTFYTSFFIMAFIWALITWGAIVTGIFSPRYFIEGITMRVNHMAWHREPFIDKWGSEKELLEEISSFWLTYIFICYYTLLVSFVIFWRKFIKPMKIPYNIRRLIDMKWLCYISLCVITFIWVFSTLNLINYSIISKDAVSKIIESTCGQVKKGQPLFDDNGVIKGIDEFYAAKLITTYYLKHIGLIYLEGGLIFLVFLFKKMEGKAKEVEPKDGT